MLKLLQALVAISVLSLASAGFTGGSLQISGLRMLATAKEEADAEFERAFRRASEED